MKVIKTSLALSLREAVKHLLTVIVWAQRRHYLVALQASERQQTSSIQPRAVYSAAPHLCISLAVLAG